MAGICHVVSFHVYDEYPTLQRTVPQNITILRELKPFLKELCQLLLQSNARISSGLQRLHAQHLYACLHSARVREICP